MLTCNFTFYGNISKFSTLYNYGDTPLKKTLWKLDKVACRLNSAHTQSLTCIASDAAEHSLAVRTSYNYYVAKYV